MRKYLFQRFLAFRYAFRGLADCIRHEPHAQLHLFATIVVFGLGAVSKLSISQWVAILLVIGLVWVAELANSALEQLADAITLHPNPLIGRAKDMAAASVLVASGVAIAVGTLVFLKAYSLI